MGFGLRIHFISPLFIFVLFLCNAFGADTPFTGPANWGGTGLMEIPTARVMEENTFRVGIGQINPYRYYFVAFSPLKGLEMDGRLTEILGTKIQDPGWQGYGNYKDKSLDIKYQFLPEQKYTPALAIGIMDPHGTRLYASQYLVASKQIYPFDFTLGLGNGRFGKRALPSKGEGFSIELFQRPKEWKADAQFFGGMQFAFSEKLLFMAEYNPIRYHVHSQDPAVSHGKIKEKDSSYSVGLRWRPIPDWVEIDASYQRGNTLGISFFMPFTIGRPMIPIYHRPYKETPPYATAPLDLRLLSGLTSVGFGNIGISWENNDLVIDLENYLYFFLKDAIHMALKTIAPIVPPTVEDVTLIFKERDVPVYYYKTTALDLALFHKGEITRNQLDYISQSGFDFKEVPKGTKYPASGIVLGYKPIFQLFLNDPSGFWKGKLGITGYASKKLWEGAMTTLGISFYPLANISTVNEPLSIPVRTDIVDYVGRKLVFDSFVISQVYRVPDTSLFLGGSLGILEIQYTGIDLEAAMPLLGGRVLIGTNGAWVKKRDPKKPWGFKKGEAKDHFRTTFLNMRLNLKPISSHLDIKYGRFLAGDKGFKVTATKVINGVSISAWYSFTDTDVFTDFVNRGYHDKGVSVTIPMRLFYGRDTRSMYTQGISPWTRDVAQDIGHNVNLFEFISGPQFLGLTR